MKKKGSGKVSRSKSAVLKMTAKKAPQQAVAQKHRLLRYPLPQAYMAGSMFLLVISAIYTFSGKLEPTWGVTFCIVFLIMFIGSLLSILPSD